jgi:hypothetical protein
MLEAMETKIRNMIEGVYIQKTHEIINGMRTINAQKQKVRRVVCAVLCRMTGFGRGAELVIVPVRVAVRAVMGGGGWKDAGRSERRERRSVFSSFSLFIFCFFFCVAVRVLV